MINKIRYGYKQTLFQHAAQIYKCQWYKMLTKNHVLFEDSTKEMFMSILGL